MESRYRNLPGVDKLLSDERLRSLEAAYPHELLVGFARRQIEQERAAISAGGAPRSLEEIAALVYEQVKLMEKPILRRVINATGVILHTNLGRAPLGREVLAEMDEASAGYCNLEFELDSGRRGSRNTHIEPLLRQVTGAEAGLVVNNNASAVLLGLTALARRKEAIVSRGQAVEIGGGFRVPDVMRQSGARLIEVGTTNCTYISDYEQAITPRTAALLRVHSSNFKMVGFTSEVGIEELVALGNKYDVPVLDDLGSGCLLDTTRFGLAEEPMVQRSISAGAALAFFSGDKLVGGPQAGIIVGEKRYIEKLRRHPLARAVRIDKTRLAGLAATLRYYLKGEAEAKVPVWRMLSAPLDQIACRAERWAAALDGAATVVPGETMVGGGSLPGGTLPTRLLAIGGLKKSQVENMNRALRQQETPVVGRISEDALLLDPRTVLPEEDAIVIAALSRLKKEIFA